MSAPSCMLCPNSLQFCQVHCQTGRQSQQSTRRKMDTKMDTVLDTKMDTVFVTLHHVLSPDKTAPVLPNMQYTVCVHERFNSTQFKVVSWDICSSSKRLLCCATSLCKTSNMHADSKLSFVLSVANLAVHNGFISAHSKLFSMSLACNVVCHACCFADVCSSARYSRFSSLQSYHVRPLSMGKYSELHVAICIKSHCNKILYVFHMCYCHGLDSFHLDTTYLIKNNYMMLYQLGQHIYKYIYIYIYIYIYVLLWLSSQPAMFCRYWQMCWAPKLPWDASNLCLALTPSPLHFMQS